MSAVESMTDGLPGSSHSPKYVSALEIMKAPAINEVLDHPFQLIFYRLVLRP